MKRFSLLSLAITAALVAAILLNLAPLATTLIAAGFFGLAAIVFALLSLGEREETRSDHRP